MIVILDCAMCLQVTYLVPSYGRQQGLWQGVLSIYILLVHVCCCSQSGVPSFLILSLKSGEVGKSSFAPYGTEFSPAGSAFHGAGKIPISQCIVSSSSPWCQGRGNRGCVPSSSICAMHIPYGLPQRLSPSWPPGPSSSPALSGEHSGWGHVFDIYVAAVWCNILDIYHSAPVGTNISQASLVLTKSVPWWSSLPLDLFPVS